MKPLRKVQTNALGTQVIQYLLQTSLNHRAGTELHICAQRKTRAGFAPYSQQQSSGVLLSHESRDASHFYTTPLHTNQHLSTSIRASRPTLHVRGGTPRRERRSSQSLQPPTAERPQDKSPWSSQPSNSHGITQIFGDTELAQICSQNCGVTQTSAPAALGLWQMSRSSISHVQGAAL